ncbi:MAG: hypothetical protein ACEQSR_13025 [Candidatus Methylacidiphilales bacterium]
MQNDKFNNILKDRAKEFVLLPNANAFENMVAYRKKAKRKRIVVFMVFLAFLMSFGTTVFFINNKHRERIESNKTVTLKSEPNLSNKPKIAEKIIKKSTGKIIMERSNKPLNIYKPNDVDSAPEMLNDIKAKQGNLNIVTSANEVNLNKNESIFHDENLQEIKKLKVYQDTALLVKKVIDSNNADTNLTDEEFLAKAINDTLSAALIANNVASSKINYKTKEPIHLSLSVFNYYMLLNKAYNGADNNLINSIFGLDYNEQANQSYSLGFLFGLTRKKISLKVGFAYNNVQFDKLFIPSDSMVTGANVKKESLVNDFGYNINVIDQSLSFVEMPILLGYTIGSKKVNYTFETGLAFQYLTQTNTYLLTSDVNGFSYNTRNDAGNNRFNQFQIAGQFSFLINYNLTRHISIYGGPITKFHLGQYFKQEFTDRSAPIYLGLNTGINFKF